MFVTILTLIFIRPFISSLAFPYVNLIYSSLLVAALLIWIAMKGVKIGRIKLIKYALLFFISALLISFLCSSNRISSIKELYKYITAIMLIFFGASLANERKLKIISAIVAAGLAISLLAIYQYLFSFRHTLDYLSSKNISDVFALDYISRGRVFSPFVTPNILAGYLIMIIPLTFINKKVTWSLVPISIALILTRSLGAFVSLSVVFFVYLCLSGKLGRKQIVVLCGLAALIALFFILRSLTPKEYLKPTFSAMMRLNYWKETWGIIKDHPFTGVGLGNFNLVYSRYAHNSYLQFWAETGILGIIGLLWLVYAIFAYGFKKSFRDSGSERINLWLLLAGSAFLLDNLTNFSFFLPEVSLIWWVILGCMLTLDTV
ncbi:MAG: hypothetical protein FJZ08_00910 [Candidatus Omnitrophica bacterium]|nr:hypothetical protein [Candidatus Omnitrophota bacterium]